MMYGRTELLRLRTSSLLFPISDLLQPQRCQTSRQGWAIRLGPLYSLFHFQTGYQVILNVLRSINFPAGAAEKPSDQRTPSHRHGSSDRKSVNIFPTSCCLQQKNQLGKLFTACKPEVRGWMNQLSTRNIFASSATPLPSPRGDYCRKKPSERRNYSTQTD